MMGIHEILGWFGLTVLKFAITPSIMIGNDYSFWETWILTSLSACIGVTVFYYFGSAIFNWIDSKRKKKKRVFSSSGRRTVRTLRKFGLVGLAVISVVLSVPIAGVLSAKFFRKPRIVLPVLYVAFTSWSFILTGISMLTVQSMNV